MVTAANRGKLAEKKLKTYLESLAVSSSCAFLRLADAHAGSRTATLCDFIFMREGVLHMVECKSTMHEYRLPHGNVDPAQVAKMRMWKHAGAKAFVMIYHEKLDLWRAQEIDYFLVREGGSWDLRGLPLADINITFNTCLQFSTTPTLAQ